MMLAAKQYDIVMGVDIHIVQPPGPVPPVPIPHPFIGIVFDPMDFVPIVGATVYVNGIPRAQAGTAAKNMPSHIPIGGVFVKPPANEGEMFMGSSTVLVEDQPFTFMSCQVLTCHDVGMVPPPRPKKKGGTKTMVLPTSVVLPIPAGQTVLIGGPPTISLMAIGMKLGMAALGKLGKLIAKSKFFKKIADKLKKALCFFTGHPVDVATGKVITDKVDFELPGPIPFKWERTYDSFSDYDGPIGYGWHHEYDMALQEDWKEGVVILRMSEGQKLAFPILKIGEQHFNRSEKLLLSRRVEGYVIQNEDQQFYRFHENKPSGAEWPLASITNQVAQAIKFEYDGRNALREIIDSAGRILKVSTDEKRRITAIFAPHPGNPEETFAIVRYKYDLKGDLMTSSDALDYSFQYQYENHLLMKETNANGLSFYFKYDIQKGVARCIHTWGDGGIYSHKLTYNLTEKYTIVENSLGYKSTHYWNDRGLVIRSMDPLGNVSTKQYSEDNELFSETDELGRNTIYAYDDLGNKTMTIFPDGSTLQMQYQGNQLISAVDQLGGIWKWSYNDASQLIARTDSLGRTTEYEYKESLLKKIIDPAGGITNVNYDNRYNLIELRTPDDASSRWEYDRLGRCITVIDPKGNAQKRKFNLNSWVRQVNEPDGNKRELEYDGEGNVVHATDKHHDVRFEYSGMNRLRARTEAGTRVEFKYDTEENLLGIINEHGYAYRFELDANGEVIVESGFDGIRRQYKRDAAKQVTQVQRASGILTSYEYDQLSRVVVVKYSDGSLEKYAYRPDGELIEAINDHAQVKFDRDLVGKVITEYQGEHSVSSVYDILGMRIDVQSSMGTHIQYQRNIMGDVLNVSANGNSEKWQASFKRDDLGLELERVMPGGVQSTWKRDKLGRPVEQKTVTVGGKISHNRKYVWDVNDRLKQIIDPQKGAWNFEHDVFGNLAAAQYPDGSVELRMPDAVGNLFKTKDRKDRKYGPAGQLLEANGTRYEYDTEGNLIKKTEPGGGIWLYKWNAAGMLSKVTRPDHIDVVFVYDALGRRISKSFRGKTTRWVWDGNVILHEWFETSFDKSGTFKIENGSKKIYPRGFDEILANAPINGPPGNEEVKLRPANQQQVADITTWLFEPESFAPLAKLNGTNHFSIITDHLGTPAAMYNTEGGKVWEMDLSIYGEESHLLGKKEDCPFRYPGQYEDVETGLFYHRFRYYDSVTGFYISQDPIRNAGDNQTFYSYVKDPNIWIDSLGLSCKKVTAKRIVIGEGMVRVKAAAKLNNAKWYQAWGKNFPKGRDMTPNELKAALKRNERWIKKKIEDGYEIIDIGLDPTRANRS
ncbi:MAG: DUF6531 domain-containing protein, partial [Saprospiraceae bacterium]